MQTTTGYAAFLELFLSSALPELERLARSYAIDWNLDDTGRERLEYSFSRTLLGIGGRRNERLLQSAHAALGDAPSPESILRWMRAYFGPRAAGKRVPALAQEIRSGTSIQATWDDGEARIELPDERGDLLTQAEAAAEDAVRAERTQHRAWFARLDAAQRAVDRRFLADVVSRLRDEGKFKSAQALVDRAEGLSYAESVEATGVEVTARTINSANQRFVRAWNGLSPSERARLKSVCPAPERRARSGSCVD